MLAAKPATTSWFGKKNDAPVEQKNVFKTSAWVTMATQNQNNEIGEIKFTPLNPNDIPK